jgi:hypothetical protein
MRCLLAHLHPSIALLSLLLATPAVAAAPVRLVEPADVGEIPGPLPVEEVVEFRVQGKDLVVRTRLAPTGGTKRVEAEGIAGTTRVSVNVRARPEVPGAGLYLRLMHAAPESENGPKVQTTVYVRPGYLELSRVETTAREVASVTLTQRDAGGAALGAVGTDDRVILRVRRMDRATNAATHDLQRRAPSVVDLLRHAPRESAEHLGPIFRTFDQEAAIFSADLRLAWQVLADVLPADAALRPRVAALVADLDHDDFRRREEAFGKLQELGGPAALLLLSQPGENSRLSPQQRSKVEAFLADYRPLSDDEAAERRRDTDFLLTCLTYSPEPGIRLAAAAALRPRDPDNRAPAIAAIEGAAERAAAAQALRANLANPPGGSTSSMATDE